MRIFLLVFTSSKRTGHSSLSLLNVVIRLFPVFCSGALPSITLCVCLFHVAGGGSWGWILAAGLLKQKVNTHGALLAGPSLPVHRVLLICVRTVRVPAWPLPCDVTSRVCCCISWSAPDTWEFLQLHCLPRGVGQLREGSPGTGRKPPLLTLPAPTSRVQSLGRPQRPCHLPRKAEFLVWGFLCCLVPPPSKRLLPAQDKRPVLLQTVPRTRTVEKLSRSRGTKETGWPNVTWGPGTDKDFQGNPRKPEEGIGVVF